MTIHLHWYCLPILIIISGIIAAFVFDSDLRHGNGGLLSGCLGMFILFLSLFLALGVAIGHYV